MDVRTAVPPTGTPPPRRGGSPFAGTAPAVVVAVVHAVAALVWAVAGARLPGGRWLAVHLFTLGVLTNVVLAFSEHFGRTLTRAPHRQARWQVPAVNVGVVAVLVGVPAGSRPAVAAGGTTVTVVVLVAYARLRRLRRGAVGARFTWVVRQYERAHAAFLHGAVLGVLLGVQVLPGTWYGPVRLAHLHVNLLGWGGLTLLATLVFFGPTIVRTRIRPGADARAARALRWGASGLTVAVDLLVLTGVGDGAATALRIGAAAGLAVLAWASTVVCLPVADVARRARRSATRWPVVALSLWFPAVVWADAAVVASGSWWLLPALGVGVGVGVLAQAIAAVLTYVAPLLRGRTAGAQDRVRGVLERGAAPRAAAYNAGVVLLVAAPPVGGPVGAAVARAGAALVVGALAHLAAAAVVGLARGGTDAPRNLPTPG